MSLDKATRQRSELLDHPSYYIPNVLYGINFWQIPWLFQNVNFVTFKECSSYFRLMEWRKITNKDISLLWEHNTFTLVCVSQSFQSTPLSCLAQIEWGISSLVYSGYKSVQVCEAISSRCISLQRKTNGSMDKAKYQSNIIHDIEILCECVVFPQMGYIFIHDITPCHN